MKFDLAKLMQERLKQIKKIASDSDDSDSGSKNIGKYPSLRGYEDPEYFDQNIAPTLEDNRPEFIGGFTDPYNMKKKEEVISEDSTQSGSSEIVYMVKAEYESHSFCAIVKTKELADKLAEAIKNEHDYLDVNVHEEKVHSGEEAVEEKIKLMNKAIQDHL